MLPSRTCVKGQASRRPWPGLADVLGLGSEENFHIIRAPPGELKIERQATMAVNRRPAGEPTKHGGGSTSSRRDRQENLKGATRKEGSGKSLEWRPSTQLRGNSYGKYPPILPSCTYTATGRSESSATIAHQMPSCYPPNSTGMDGMDDLSICHVMQHCNSANISAFTSLTFCTLHGEERVTH